MESDSCVTFCSFLCMAIFFDHSQADSLINCVGVNNGVLLSVSLCNCLRLYSYFITVVSTT